MARTSSTGWRRSTRSTRRSWRASSSPATSAPRSPAGARSTRTSGSPRPGGRGGLRLAPRQRAGAGRTAPRPRRLPDRQLPGRRRADDRGARLGARLDRRPRFDLGYMATDYMAGKHLRPKTRLIGAIADREWFFSEYERLTGQPLDRQAVTVFGTGFGLVDGDDLHRPASLRRRGQHRLSPCLGALRAARHAAGTDRSDGLVAGKTAGRQRSRFRSLGPAPPSQRRGSDETASSIDARVTGPVGRVGDHKADRRARLALEQRLLELWGGRELPRGVDKDLFAACGLQCVLLGARVLIASGDAPYPIHTLAADLRHPCA